MGITLCTGVCCLLLWKQVNVCIYFPHTLMDFNETWVIDVRWKPLFIDEAKGHIPRAKVISGQVLRLAKNVKFSSIEKLKSNWNQTCFKSSRFKFSTFLCYGIHLVHMLKQSVRAQKWATLLESIAFLQSVVILYNFPNLNQFIHIWCSLLWTIFSCHCIVPSLVDND